MNEEEFFVLGALFLDVSMKSSTTDKEIKAQSTKHEAQNTFL